MCADIVTDTATPPADRVRWIFPRRDVFAGLDAGHRLTLIHSLPGVVFWPLLLYALIFAFQYGVYALYSAVPGLADLVGFTDAAFTATAAAYGTLALAMWHRFRRYDSHHRVFAVLPVKAGDFLAALLVLAFMVLFAGQLSLSFHEFAMGDPSLTLSGGASPEDLTNVDDFTGAGASLLSLVLLTLVAAPLVEEFLFRGWMLPMMMARGVPTVFAIAISALAFGLMHIAQGLLVVASTFLLAIALGLARVATGRMAAPILGHIANNAWAVFASPYFLSQASA